MVTDERIRFRDAVHGAPDGFPDRYPRPFTFVGKGA